MIFLCDFFTFVKIYINKYLDENCKMCNLWGDGGGGEGVGNGRS